MKGKLKKVKSYGIEAAGSIDKCALYYFELCYSQNSDGSGYNCIEGKKYVFTGNPDEVIEYVRNNNIKIYEDASFLIIPVDYKNKFLFVIY